VFYIFLIGRQKDAEELELQSTLYTQIKHCATVGGINHTRTTHSPLLLRLNKWLPLMCAPARWCW